MSEIITFLETKQDFISGIKT